MLSLTSVKVTPWPGKGHTHKVASIPGRISVLGISEDDSVWHSPNGKVPTYSGTPLTTSTAAGRGLCT